MTQPCFSWSADHPQVQVIHKYVATEPDELSLEESDVINVFKKITDGTSSRRPCAVVSCHVTKCQKSLPEVDLSLCFSLKKKVPLQSFAIKDKTHNVTRESVFVQLVVVIAWGCLLLNGSAPWTENAFIICCCCLSSGWYEGERIRDGQRGWFPANHTLEIESAHVRARNLKQRYRLLTFAHMSNRPV